jgi:uncharacterized protein (DUF1499 family)
MTKMDDAISSNSKGMRACVWSVRLAGTGIVLVVIGLVGARIGLAPLPAMLLLTLGSLFFIVAGITGAIGLFRSQGGGSNKVGAWIAVALAIAAVISLGSMMGGGAAPIHDISTDTADPPEFVEVALLRGPDDNPVEYSGPESAALQAEAYPDLETIVLLDPRSFVFELALQVATDMGWEIVASDAAEGRIEATATTPFVGFKDDVVIRVRAKGAETLVDVRSKSRFGRGDMGVNAARIREFRDELIEAANP